MINRCYLETTNICNLSCKFCPKNERHKKRLNIQEFSELTDRLAHEVKFLYLHLMGEPFLNPNLPDFVEIARGKGLIPIVTTNGTLLGGQIADRLIEAKPYKIQISLHSHEGNGFSNQEEYIAQVVDFAKKSASQGIITTLRLWNEGGYNTQNNEIHNLISQQLPQPWTERSDGWKIAQNIYMEYDKMFEWPDEKHTEYQEPEVFCYGLRNQIGVLVDGSVVPCCLDHDGTITLGNLHESTLQEILTSPRAKAIYEGFSRHEAVEELCRKCGYANVGKRYRG